MSKARLVIIQIMALVHNQMMLPATPHLPNWARNPQTFSPNVSASGAFAYPNPVSHPSNFVTFYAEQNRQLSRMVSTMNQWVLEQASVASSSISGLSDNALKLKIAELEFTIHTQSLELGELKKKNTMIEIGIENKDIELEQLNETIAQLRSQKETLNKSNLRLQQQVKVHAQKNKDNQVLFAKSTEKQNNLIAKLTDELNKNKTLREQQHKRRQKQLNNLRKQLKLSTKKNKELEENNNIALLKHQRLQEQKVECDNKLRLCDKYNIECAHQLNEKDNIVRECREQIETYKTCIEALKNEKTNQEYINNQEQTNKQIEQLQKKCEISNKVIRQCQTNQDDLIQKLKNLQMRNKTLKKERCELQNKLKVTNKESFKTGYWYSKAPHVFAMHYYDGMLQICQQLGLWLTHVGLTLFSDPAQSECVYQLFSRMVQHGTYNCDINVQLVENIINFDIRPKWRESMERLFEETKKKYKTAHLVSEKKKIERDLEATRETEGKNAFQYIYKTKAKRILFLKKIQKEMHHKGALELSKISDFLCDKSSNEAFMRCATTSNIIASYEWDPRPDNLILIVKDIVEVTSLANLYPEEILFEMLHSSHILVKIMYKYHRLLSNAK